MIIPIHIPDWVAKCKPNFGGYAALDCTGLPLRDQLKLWTDVEDACGKS